MPFRPALPVILTAPFLAACVGALPEGISGSGTNEPGTGVPILTDFSDQSVTLSDDEQTLTINGEPYTRNVGAKTDYYISPTESDQSRATVTDEYGAGTLYQATNFLVPDSDDESYYLGVAAYGSNGTDPTNNAGSLFTAAGATTVLPTGFAIYNGEYVALLLNNAGASGQEVQGIITGDASLTALFGDATISGTIVNRALLDKNGNAVAGSSVADADLNIANIAGDGTYQGTTSGGAITLSGTNPYSINEDGEYVGVLVGSNAEGTGGLTKILHERDDTMDPYSEFGTFVGTK